jgi:hypothetical protein
MGSNALLSAMVGILGAQGQEGSACGHAAPAAM